MILHYRLSTTTKKAAYEKLNSVSLFINRYNAIATVQSQPPPPYQQPSQTFSMNATTLVPSYGGMQQTQCPVHQTQPCTCARNPTEVRILFTSPGTFFHLTAIIYLSRY